MDNKNKSYHSISKRLPLLISISFLILLLIAIVITFFRVEERMKTEYRRMADGVTNLMIQALDNDKMDQYIEENYSSEEYVNIIKQYYTQLHTYRCQHHTACHFGHRHKAHGNEPASDDLSDCFGIQIRE